MTKFWLAIVLLVWAFDGTRLVAQSFEDGYQSYVRNQFPVAELQFKNALKKASAEEDRAYILKFIGICQYMRGDKKNAQISFRQALTLDKNVQIDAEEVLDPSILAFFNPIKTSMANELKKPKPALPAPAQAQTGPRPVKPPAFDGKVRPKMHPKASVRTTRPSANPTQEDPESEPGALSQATYVEKKKVGYRNFLPLGIPQLQNKSYVYAGGFALLQTATLYLAYDADRMAQSRRGLNNVVRLKEGLTAAQREDFYSKNSKYIDDLRSQKYLAIGAFTLLWGASIVESLYLQPKSSPSTLRKSRTPEASEPALSPYFTADQRGPSFGLSWQKALR